MRTFICAFTALSHFAIVSIIADSPFLSDPNMAAKSLQIVPSLKDSSIQHNVFLKRTFALYLSYLEQKLSANVPLCLIDWNQVLCPLLELFLAKYSTKVMTGFKLWFIHFAWAHYYPNEIRKWLLHRQATSGI